MALRVSIWQRLWQRTPFPFAPKRSQTIHTIPKLSQTRITLSPSTNYNIVCHANSASPNHPYNPQTSPNHLHHPQTEPKRSGSTKHSETIPNNYKQRQTKNGPCQLAKSCTIVRHCCKRLARLRNHGMRQLTRVQQRDSWRQVAGSVWPWPPALFLWSTVCESKDVPWRSCAGRPELVSDCMDRNQVA